MNKPKCKTYSNGTKEWWLNGKRHREGGPATEWRNGHKEWWLNGKRHREDGPAIEWSNGAKEWYLDGEEVDPETLVDLWLEREVFCWYDETNDCLNVENKISDEFF